jgi:hypothetical protein
LPPGQLRAELDPVVLGGTKLALKHGLRVAVERCARG